MPIPFILPALAAAGTALVSNATDPYRKANKKAIKGLEGDVATGTGLDAGQKSLMSSTGMAPVRAQAGSMASELARLQAASGGMGGGAALAQQRDAIAGTIGSAAERVGSRVAAADSAALAGKKAELEDRKFAQAQQRNALIGSLVGIGGTALNDAAAQRGALPGTFNLGGDVEQSRAARRAPQAGVAAPPSTAPTGGGTAQAMLQRASETQTQQAALARALVPYELRARFDALVAGGMNAEQARQQLMGGV